MILFPALNGIRMHYRLSIILFFIMGALQSQQLSVTDSPFWQEYQEAFKVGNAAEENDVRSIAVDKQSGIWAATAAGIFVKKSGSTVWSCPFEGADKGPAYAALTDNQSVWMGTWNGVFRYDQQGQLKKIMGTSGPVSSLCASKEGIYALGPKGIWLYDGVSFRKKSYDGIARSVRNAVSDNDGGLWVASDVGLYHCANNKAVNFNSTTVLISAYVRDVALDNDSNVWAAGLGGVSVIRNGVQQKSITPAQGIPSIAVNCVKRNADGQMWVGTDVGIVRYNPDGSHSLRFTRRWLLDDHVRSIAFDKEGGAWIATAKGVSAIKRKRMTLASKNDFFYDMMMKRHIRDPWIAGQCKLAIPGDINSWHPEDDDNDGEFTGNYLAMESFRYAVTKSDDARIKAKKAFDFLKLLQDVTGSHGFFARTIVPADWKHELHDVNRTFTERELADELVKEPRFKPVELRWRKSADGKWLWKGDASSDEMCGHMMGYYFYYELAADKEEKKIVAKHIASIVDHLIDNNYNMMDVDGTHTRWSVWSPDMLNRDPEWSPDKSQNSMELLTFLKLANYVTGNKKYQDLYLKLIKEEHYLENMAKLKDQNPAWFIYFDVLLQSYLYPILLHCEKDPKLLAFYNQQFDQWMDSHRKEHNPQINFFYNYATNKKIGLEDAYDFLVDTPLDLINWTIDHTKREDVKIVRQPVMEELQVNELPPASIRLAIRWDRNPWVAVSGFPDIEREPVFWLLPYWMGRYLKMIQ